MSLKLCALVAFSLVTLSHRATAQTYPSRAITVVVPFPAGGPSDVVARIVTDHMSRTLGEQLVIENVGGAGGTIGSARVATAGGHRGGLAGSCRRPRRARRHEPVAGGY